MAATTRLLATRQPGAVAGTATGSSYRVQNSGGDLLYLAIATTAPDEDAADVAFFKVPPDWPWFDTPALEAGESIWLWSRLYGANIECAVQKLT